MIRRIGLLGCVAFCLLAPVCGGQESGGVEERTIVDQWRDVLRFGIEGEVLKTIKGISQAEERSLDAELAKLLRQSLNTEVRVAVLDLFAENSVRSAEDAALVLLRQEDLDDPPLAVAAIRYLAAIDSESVEPELLRLVATAEQSTADERLVESALLALGRVGSSASGALLLEKLDDPAYPDGLKPEIILALGKLKYGPAVEPLIGIALDRNLERIWRMYAAASLGEIGDPRAVDSLKEMFREQDSLLKVYAASALSHFGMEEVELLLQEGLRDSNERVRAAAAQALGTPEATASTEFLIYKATNDPVQKVRVESIRALGRIGSRAALEFLRELYAKPLVPLAYREEALAALCRSDLQGSLDAIAKVLDKEWKSREQKLVGLTARILSTQDFPGLKDLYERFLGHPDVGVRIYGLRGIARNHLGSLRGRVEMLSREDPHPAVKRAAASALDRL